MCINWSIFSAFFSLVHLARQRLRYIFGQSTYDIEEYGVVQSTFTDILLDLSRYECDELVQGSLHLLNRLYSSEINMFRKAIQTELLVAQDSKKVFGVVEEELPVMRRLMSIDLGSDQRKQLVVILQKFTDMCILEGDETYPHQQNQKILYNYGGWS